MQEISYILTGNGKRVTPTSRPLLLDDILIVERNGARLVHIAEKRGPLGLLEWVRA